MGKDLGTFSFRYAGPDEAAAIRQFHIDNPADGVYLRKVEDIRASCAQGNYLVMTDDRGNIAGTAALYTYLGGKAVEFGSWRVRDDLNGFNLSNILLMSQSINLFFRKLPIEKYFADVQKRLTTPHNVFKRLGWEHWDAPKDVVDAFRNTIDSADATGQPPVVYYALGADKIPGYAGTLHGYLKNASIRNERTGDTMQIDVSRLPFLDWLKPLSKQNYSSLKQR